MSLRNVLLTGVTGAIGKAISIVCAQQPSTRLILAVRNQKAGEAIAYDIIKSSGNSNVYVESVDLSSKQSIESFTEQFSKKYTDLHVLINNAAIVNDERKLTADKMEVCAYFFLVSVLLE